MVPTERLALVRKCCKQHQLTSVTAVVTLKSIAVACFFTNNSVTCGKNRQLLLAIFILAPTQVGRKFKSKIHFIYKSTAFTAVLLYGANRET